MSKKAESTATRLIPADPLRCQSIITPAHSPFAFGPRPKPTRCENKPATIATETRAQKDGQRGSMSLCSECWAVFNKQMPAGYATFGPVSL